MIRCYKKGIPDEVPKNLAKINRAPSYKSIAICILKGDLLLKGLGFSGYESETSRLLHLSKKSEDEKQKDLFI